MTCQPRKLGEWAGRRGPWRRWFAWHPVMLGYHGRWVWLRTIHRRYVTYHRADFGGLHKDYGWEYRETPS